MNRTIVERLPRAEGLLKVVQSEFEQDKSVFFESGRSRHIEKSLIGKYPLEAIQSTQLLSATSGVAHAVGAATALENYLQLDPTPSSLQIRQVMLQLSTLRAHILHFYFELAPDYLNSDHFESSDTLKPFLRFDFRPAEKKEGDLSIKAGIQILGHVNSASRALDILQQAITLITGKFPVVMNLIPGGVSNFRIDRVLLMKLTRSLEQIKPFIEVTWPGDVKTFIRDLPDTVTVPVKKVNLISFGSISSGKKEGADTIYSDGVLINGKLEPINELLITESLAHTYYVPVRKKGVPEQNGYDFNKEGARTWIKGARYDGESMLTGALSRMMITHFGGSNLEISDRVGKMIDDLGLTVESPNCTASRLLAEVFEGRFYIKSTLKLLLNYKSNQPLNRQTAFEFLKPGAGIGRIEAPGGSLLHQVFIKDDKITQYRIISAANWNFSTLDTNGKRGIVESELNAVLEKQDLSAELVSRIVHGYNAQILDGTQ